MPAVCPHAHGLDFTGHQTNQSACFRAVRHSFLACAQVWLRVQVTGADIPMPYASNLEYEAIPKTKHVVNAIFGGAEGRRAFVGQGRATSARPCLWPFCVSNRLMRTIA
eukprot:4601815-Pleurochrysis_carterae.AAC.1